MVLYRCVISQLVRVRLMNPDRIYGRGEALAHLIFNNIFNTFAFDSSKQMTTGKWQEHQLVDHIKISIRY